MHDFIASVIAVSSCQKENWREMRMNVGADCYLMRAIIMPPWSGDPVVSSGGDAGSGFQYVHN